jgi:hypothetical protein
MQDLLHHLGVGHEALPQTDGALQQHRGPVTIGMGTANEIHGDVRVHEHHGHSCPSPMRPRAVSSSSVSTSPVGYP